MTRCCTLFVLLATLLAATNAPRTSGQAKANFKDIKIDGTLAADDPNDPQRNTPCKIHVVALKAGQRYTIDMIGRGFDAFLRLEDKAGKQLAEDDDSGGDLNAQIVFNCTMDGDYRIFCTCVGKANGKYTLTVKAAAALALSGAHAPLLGKPAPDFQSDFALNGEAIKLSALKGKVVALHFWAVQSSDSVSTLPRLREWQKLHRDAGLAVVGVTYYNCELNHRIGFDPATGMLTRIDAATPATDEAMMKAFAAHHKLNYPLCILHKEKAVTTFANYLVDGLPQLVLIDRQGVVRFACAGGNSMRNPDVEVEIKKLLAEKRGP
jgi:thiol-disulfide isomerase/thioredoxin